MVAVEVDGEGILWDVAVIQPPCLDVLAARPFAQMAQVFVESVGKGLDVVHGGLGLALGGGQRQKVLGWSGLGGGCVHEYGFGDWASGGLLGLSYPKGRGHVGASGDLLTYGFVWVPLSQVFPKGEMSSGGHNGLGLRS